MPRKGLRFRFFYNPDRELGYNTGKTVFINLAAFNEPNYDFYCTLIHEVLEALIYREVGDFWKAHEATEAIMYILEEEGEL